MNTPSSRDKIPSTVVFLGLAMFCVNVSYVMIYALFPIYLKTVKGSSMVTIGLIEGVAEAISQIMKLTSGILSDMFLRRKPLIVFGYAILVFSRPFIAFSHSILGISVGRMLERFGNGVQGTPRDALIGDIAPRSKRGQSYGLSKSIGTMGSILGGVVAYMAMLYWQADFQKIFFLSIIPATAGFILIVLCVKEVPKKFQKQKTHGFSMAKIKQLGKPFLLLMVVNTIFMLSRFSEGFMTLHGHLNFGLTKESAPIIMVIFNIGQTLSAYPIGFLADRTNRYTFLCVGIASLIIASLIFYKATSINEFWIGVLMWGIQLGTTTNIFISLIVDFVDKTLHGTAFGCYFLLNAICAFIADNYAGFLSEHFFNGHGQCIAYLISAIIASLSLVFLMVVMRYMNHKKI